MSLIIEELGFHGTTNSTSVDSTHRKWMEETIIFMANKEV